MKIYLANPCSLKEPTREWQNMFKHVEWINPLYDIDQTDKRTVVSHDIEAIKKCDCILAMMTDPGSIGTIMEIVIARLYGKKVIVYCPDVKRADHPWIRTMADIVFIELEDVARWLTNLSFVIG